MPSPSHTSVEADTAVPLLAVCLAAATMPLAFTGPAIAMADISRALAGGPVALNWVTNAFMLAFGGTLMAMGVLADNYGRRRVFLAGLMVFAAASLALIVAPNLMAFDLLRAVQGLGSAAALSGGTAALAQIFEGPVRTRAFSLLGTTFGLGLAFGPLASGLMVERFGWRSLFLLELTLAVLAFGAGVAGLRESRDPHAGGLDWPGAATFTVSLSALTFAVIEAPARGWSDPWIVGLLSAAALLLAAFVVIERRVARPMLDLSLFRYPRFVGVQVLAAAPAYGYVVLLVLLPIRFVGIEGLSAIAAGRLMMALSGPLLVVPVLAGLLSRWISPATLCGSGLLLAAAGLAWLGRQAFDGSEAALVAPMLAIGVGVGLPWGLMDGLAVSVVPKERAGMATGLFNTTRVAGEGVALAVVGAVFVGLTASRLTVSSGSAAAVQAAQQLATGNLAAAAAALPGLAPSVLRADHAAAFAALLDILALITLVTAAVVFVTLGRGSGPRREPIRSEASDALVCKPSG